MTTDTTQRPQPAAATPPTSAHLTPSQSRFRSGPATLGAVLIGAGILGLLVQAGVEVPVRVVGALALVLVGIGVAVGAVRGERSSGALSLAIVIGVIVAIVSLGASILDVPVGGAIGERDFSPSSISDLQPEYRHLIGELRIDLTDVEFGPGTTELAVSTVLGQVHLQLPPDVAVEVDSGVGAGTAVVLGTNQDGVDVDNDQRTPDYAEATSRVHVTARVGLGEIHVDQAR